MAINWAHAWPAMTAAFLASSVEIVEAFTVVLAVGGARGWRGALSGAGAALASLPVLIVILRPALARIPIEIVQIVVGPLLLLFGLRWLRKAILRGAGVISLHDEQVHDEQAVFAEQDETMSRRDELKTTWDLTAFATSFKITMVEGLEVVFIVIAVGAGGSGLLVPAAVGATAALVSVTIVGLAIHKPLSQVPENTMKFIVGILLSAFGTFWFGEGIGIRWPGGDFATILLTIAYAATGLIAVGLALRSNAAGNAIGETRQ